MYERASVFVVLVMSADEALTLDSLDQGTSEVEKQPKIFVPAHVGDEGAQPELVAPSPSASSENAEARRHGALANFLNLDTSTLDNALEALHVRISNNEHEIKRIDVLEEAAARMNKFMIEQTLNKGSSDRMKIVTPGGKKTNDELVVSKSSKDLHLCNLDDDMDDVVGNRPRTASKLSRSMTADVSEFIEASPFRKKNKKLTVDDEQDEYIAKTRREIVGLRTLVRQVS